MNDFITKEFLIALIASFPASITFAILYKVNKRHLLLGGLSGTVTYFIYYVIEYLSASVFLAAMVSAVFTALFAELAARVRRAPTIVFLIPGVIPTVPGGALYKAMRFGLENDWTPAFDNLMAALLISLGIASGIVVVTAAWGSISERIARRKAKSSATLPKEEAAPLPAEAPEESNEAPEESNEAPASL